MSDKYSVEVRSRFAALPIDDEENTSKVNVQVKTPKETSGEKKIVKTHNESPIAVSKVNDSPRGRGGKITPRGNRGGMRGAFRGGKVDGATSSMASTDTARPRGRGRGGRASGMRMDRHSGSDRTGVKPTAKKDGYGTGNWGTVEDELEVTINSEQQNMENNQDNGDGEEPNIESEPQVITFSEYKAARSKEAKAEAASIRKPNDGKDVFKNMIIKNPSVKKTQVTEEESKENIKTFDENDDPITFECVNEIKTFDDRSKTFNSRNTDSRGGARGGRGGRGAGRGRGFGDNSSNMRGGRVNAPRVPVPSITNAEEFPALA